jgi:MFS transporter, Spinster family, sphingosine-1-phosphate transporter
MKLYLSREIRPFSWEYLSQPHHPLKKERLFMTVNQSQLNADNGTQKAELDIPRWKANFWLAVITLIYILDMADRNIVAAILPALKKEFALSDASSGLIAGILYLSMFLLVVPCGLLVDKWSRKYLITIMVSLWSAATWVTGLTTNYGQLLLARLGVGAGEAGYNPASYALIGAWFPPKQRATKVGVFSMGQTLGVILGLGVAGMIAHYWGWRYVFGVFAVPGFILAILMLFAPDYKTKKVEAGIKQEEKVSIGEIFRYILSTRTLLLVFIVQLPVTLFIIGFVTWAPSFYGRCWNLNMAQAGQINMLAAALFWPGPWFGGWLSDKLAAGNPKGRITAALICLAIPIVLYTAGFWGGHYKINIIVVFAFLTLAQFFFSGNWSSLVAASLDLVPLPYRGTCQSLLLLFQTSVAFFAGAVIGAISDKVGLPLALWISMIVLCGLALLILLMTYKTYNRDFEKKDAAGKFELESA